MVGSTALPGEEGAFLLCSFWLADALHGIGRTQQARALTVLPGRPGSLAVTDVAELEPGDDELLVDGLAVGVCGTDREIAAGSTANPARACRRGV
jgi:hypothetical protein